MNTTILRAAVLAVLLAGCGPQGQQAPRQAQGGHPPEHQDGQQS